MSKTIRIRIPDAIAREAIKRAEAEVDPRDCLRSNPITEWVKALIYKALELEKPRSWHRRQHEAALERQDVRPMSKTGQRRELILELRASGKTYGQIVVACEAAGLPISLQGVKQFFMRRRQNNE